MTLFSCPNNRHKLFVLFLIWFHFLVDFGFLNFINVFELEIFLENDCCNVEIFLMLRLAHQHTAVLPSIVLSRQIFFVYIHDFPLNNLEVEKSDFEQI